MNKKSKALIISIVAILIIYSLGITYAFFTATIENGDKGSSVVIETATLGLRYSEDDIVAPAGFMPGDSFTYNFYVENIGNGKVDFYNIYMDFLNTFVTKSDMVYEIMCISVNTSTWAEKGNCEGVAESIVPSGSELILIGSPIDVGITHRYTVKFTFKETGVNQNDNQGKTISGKITVRTDEEPTSNNNIVVDLEDGMIPIMWNGSSWVIADTSNKSAIYSWYEYCQSTYLDESDYKEACEFKWANMALVSEGEHTRDYFKNAPLGTPVEEKYILAQFVYIPRYRYLLWNADNGSSDEQEIKIVFENISTIKSSGSVNGEWLTHPAFTFGEAELNGIWVGKFETSAETASTCYTTPNATNCDKKTGITPRIKGNVDSWRYATVSTYFDISKMFKSNAMYGISSTTIDSHMVKNMEWGAVAYLYHSKYGKYGNSSYTGANKELYINNYNKNDQAFNKLTGCSAGAPSTAESTTCSYAYPNITTSGTGASTTGTIYGIYDMSGGAFEYVMGNMVNSSGIFQVSSAGTFTGGTPNAKYYDSYAYDALSNLTHARGKRGDATKETLKIFGNVNGGWYLDAASLPASTNSWVLRGGFSRSGTLAGIFAVNPVEGIAYPYYSSRTVLV